MHTTLGGLGVDIEDIERFTQRPISHHRTFYEKIFSANEIEYCMKKKNPYPHFAVRFCAKEAFMKAIGNPKPNYQEIEVIVVDDKPFVVWNSTKYTVSLSHDQTKAIAVVIL